MILNYLTTLVYKCQTQFLQNSFFIYKFVFLCTNYNFCIRLHVQLNAFLRQNSRRFNTRKYTKNHILQSRDNYSFLSQKHGFYLINDAIKLPFSQKSRLCVFQNPLFFHPFLRRSILQIYTVLRLFRLSFLYILFLTFIKGFLIKANTFRVLCGIKSIEYIKNDRALCAPSSLFLQLTIRSRPVVFDFSMPISASFSLFLS